MDIYWFGQACIKIKGKQATVIIDPFKPEYVGLKAPKPTDLEAHIALKTHDHQDHNALELVGGDPVRVEGPGEYEIRGVMINGVSTYHDKQKGAERGKNTAYHLQIDGLNIVHLGDLGDQLTEDQVQEIGTTDILFIPVGGVYTIDAKDASEVVAQLEPRVIIPIHYKVDGLKFELAGVEDFLKQMGVEHPEPLAKLSISKDKLPEEPTVIVLAKN